MASVYINGASSIGCQTNENLDALSTNFVDHEERILFAQKPNVKELIPSAAARRMAKGVKMSIATSAHAMEQAGVNNTDAIIVGTGMGCLIDSEKFLRALIDHDEQHLTPTPFIQSTHNTVAGQIALTIGCTGYNFTYVNGAASFSSALLDAYVQIKTDELSNALVGGVDELAEHTTKIQALIDHVRAEPVRCSELYDKPARGAVFGEGAQFFYLANEQNTNSLGEVIGVRSYNTLEPEQLSTCVTELLRDWDLKAEEVDLILLGENGDSDFQSHYQAMRNALPNTTAGRYKHLSGEYYTAPAFAMWIATQIVSGQSVPAGLITQKPIASPVKKVLLYDHYRGQDHSFMLIGAC